MQKMLSMSCYRSFPDLKVFKLCYLLVFKRNCEKLVTYL